LANEWSYVISYGATFHLDLYMMLSLLGEKPPKTWFPQNFQVWGFVPTHSPIGAKFGMQE